MASIPSAFSFPIRAPPSSHSSDEEREGRAVEKKKKGSSSSSSSSSSESEAFHSGAEEEFEMASERPFAGDPDEEIVEVAPTGPGGAVQGIGASVGSLLRRKAMPIARVSGGDDGGGKGFGDGGFVGGVGGDDGVSGVARVSLSKAGQEGFGGSGKQEAFAGGNLEGGVPVGRPEIVSAEKENFAGRDSALTDEVLDSVPPETLVVEPAAADVLVSGIGSNSSIPADGRSVVEGLGNLEAAKADYAMEYENEAAGINSAEKQLVSITASAVAAPQSGLQSEPASTDEAGSGSEHGSHAIVKDLACSDAVGVVEVVGIGDSSQNQFQSAALSNSRDKSGLADLLPDSTDVVVKFEQTSSVSYELGHATRDLGEAATRIVEKKEEVIPAVVESPLSGSHVKAGSVESEPLSTDSVAIAEVVGDGFDQVLVEDLGKELANSDVTENKDAVGDGASDKNLEPVIAASNEASPAAEGTNILKPVETEKNESGLGSVNMGAKQSELVLAAVEELENRYETQTALSNDCKAIESTIDKDTRALVIEDSESPEMAKDVPKSSDGTPIVDASVNARENVSECGILGKERENSVENLLSGSVSAESEVKQETLDFGAEGDDEEEDMGDSGTVERIIREIERGSSSSQLESAGDNSKKIVDGQIIPESDEDVETDEEGDGKELFDSAALAALLKAASSAASDGTVTVNASDAARFFQLERPAGLGSSAPSLKPAPRSSRPNIFAPSDLAVVGEPENNMDEEEKKLHEKIQQIRVKFLRLVQRLGHAPEDTVAQQVLYRLDLAEGLRRGRQTNRSSRESAKKMAMQLEESGTDDLNFSCNILILGKTGVGKSATINSIFGQEKSPMSAFKPATSGVKEIFGIVDGVKIRVIDTPGLSTSIMDQKSNGKILSSIKKFMKKCPPDIVLYIDRLDTQTRDFNDLPLLRSISSVLGPSIWLNAIVALTHAASAPPDGPNGTALSYEVFVAQRSHIVQHSIRQAAGDMRLMNPVALVENHPSCRRNREGERVLPNGQNWRPQLLLLCYSSKILSEANSLLKLQDQSTGKLFGFRIRSPPLPFLLSSLLQSRAHPKLSNEMIGESVDSDIDLDDLSDSEQQDGEDEYDQLPPFKPLKKSQIAKLSKEQRKAYFDEYGYRLKLLQKQQWKQELRRLRESKKRGTEVGNDFGGGDVGGDNDPENGGPAAVPVPLPDMVLPPSFDCDSPTYRYRFLEPSAQFLARPVLDTHGWDHDCGYDGVSLEQNLAVLARFPANMSVQITKDKKEFNIHLDSSVSAKHGENRSSMAGFDIQSVGKQLAYFLRGETKFRSYNKHKTTVGASVTFLGENVATGLKVEDQFSIGKCVNLVASTGAIRAQGDMAYGANLEARLREKDFPVGQDQSTLGLSLMRWRGDLALGANLQSQFSVGWNTKMAIRLGLNNKRSGQITVRTSSSESVQIALMGAIPIAAAIIRTIWPSESFIGH